MMGGLSPETCWASYKYEIKFWYTVASCWISLWIVSVVNSEAQQTIESKHMRNFPHLVGVNYIKFLHDAHRCTVTVAHSWQSTPVEQNPIPSKLQIQATWSSWEGSTSSPARTAWNLTTKDHQSTHKGLANIATQLRWHNNKYVCQWLRCLSWNSILIK